MNSGLFSDLGDSTTRGVKLLAIVGLVLIVSFAGCTGVVPLGSDDGSDNSSDGEKRQEEITYPDSFSKSGIENPKKAAEHHIKTLFERDSFTIQIDVNISRSGRESSSFFRVTLDAANKRGHIAQGVTSSGQSISRHEIYYSNGTDYTMNQTYGGKKKYNVSGGSFNINVTNETMGLNRIMENASFGTAEEIERNGETFLRYKANKTKSNEPFVDADSTIKDFNATMVVDQNGIIQKITYSIGYTTSEGKQEAFTFRYKTTNIGSTSVEEPDWVDEANTQTS